MKEMDSSVIGSFTAEAMEGLSVYRNRCQPCLRCGHCESRCPFGVNQESRMEQINNYFGG